MSRSQVAFNYRLGPLGFMSLNSSEYSGNMGLKDQLLAIQWTKENIGYFGGDSNKITLYGLSAGMWLGKICQNGAVKLPEF